jgi:hypothetical protein
MARRFLLPGAVLLLILLLVPACTSATNDSGKGKMPPGYKYEPPPEPKAGGKSG